MNRNDFLESIHFNISGAIEEYSKYAIDYKKDFFSQATQTHKAIAEAFPELNFHTICRIKSFNSSLDKIKHRTLEKVFDIHGIKHIIHAVNDDNSEPTLMAYCYKLKTFLEDYYGNLGVEISRIKDYIATPKESGYEALHLSGKVVNENGRKFETQIKTAGMEKEAKYGNANHSEKYKPRTLGKNPLSKVPRYMVIITRDNGEIVSNEMSLSSCFQYFYNVPYEDYFEHIQAEK